MAWKSDQSGPQKNRGGWSGSGRSREQPLHRWQDAGTSTGGNKARSRRRHGRWIVTSLLAAGLLSTLVYLLLISPKMTPVAVISVTDYALPVPLNPWAREDRNAINDLHEKNLAVHDISSEWIAQSNPDIGLLIEGILPNRPRDREPLIVYISAHGIVNDKAEPCLLRPDASVYDSTSWIRVEDILKRLNTIAPARAKLLVLDCNRIRVNWNLGILYNSFVERVRQVVGKPDTQNVAVLVSAGPGQTNWAAADLNGSVFGRYLQLGLAGAADEADGGDGAVSLHELAGYLEREVDGWSRFNRGESQKPVLMPDKDQVDDFRLTWVVQQGDLEDLKDQFRNQEAPDPSVPPEDLGALWAKFSALRERDLVRYDPVACRDLEHELLRLDELAHGGAAYSGPAKRQFDLLEGKITDAFRRAAAAEESGAVAEHSGIISAAKWARIPSAVYTLPVSEYFGAHGADASKQIQSLWTSLVEVSDQQDTNAIIENSSAKAFARDFAETQFLIALRDQHVAALWRRRPVNLREVLRQRNNAEQLAVPRRSDGQPGDERAHYYARSVGDKADEARRRAEDVLFVGENNAPEQYEVLAERSAKLYEQASQVMESATAAYHAHDSALAESPYLAAWMCSPLATHLPDRDNSVQQIVRLVRNTRHLGEAINRHEKLLEKNGASEGDLQSYRELANEVQRDLQQVHTKLETQFNGLSKGDAQGTRGWRAIETVLQVPLIPGEIRAELLDNRNKVSAELYRQYFESDTRKPPAADESSGDYLDVLAEWSPHPFVEIMRSAGLSGEAAVSGDGNEARQAWCEIIGGQLRQRLAELPASSSATRGARETPPEDGVLYERNLLSLAERQLRAAAAIDFETAQAAADPILDLRRFDLQQLLIWHAQRTMDDFWGSVSSPGGEETFFARAAKSYLQAAEGLGATSLAVGDQIASANRILAARVAAKGERLQIGAATRPSVEDAGPIAISLRVAPGSQAAQYPPGVAALQFRGGQHRLPDLAFARSAANDKSFVELPPVNGKPQQLEASIPKLSITSAMLQAVAFFRGREDVSPEFAVPVLEGVLIDYKPHQYTQQRITLYGERLQRTSIVFILDCSTSMGIMELVEVAPGKSEERPRLELAKSALNDMLRDLADRNRNGEDNRVGVWAFGHRMGWTTNDPSTIKRQKGYPIPNTLTPALDVEQIQPLGRFDNTEAGKIQRKLDRVTEALGQSPLNLALVKAIESFAAVNAPNTRESIIVLSDGVDVQFTPAHIPNRPAKTSQAVVLAALRRHPRPLPIHILGFDIPANQAQRPGSIYQEIAIGSKGTYREVESGADLLRQIRERLDVDGYIVRDHQRQPVNPMNGRDVVPSKLNSPVAIPPDRPLPQEFSVHFRNVPPKQVLLEGGEAIELHVSQNGPAQDIVAWPYDRSVVAQANLVSGVGGSPTNHIVRVHRPRRQEGSVEFPVSLQVDPSVDHFTKRPVETWVEVTPLAGSTPAAEPYVFYDRNLEPETPVPVLIWTAQNWPEQADHARIRYWCKYDPTDPVQTISWREVVTSPTAFSVPKPVLGVTGVVLTVESSTESDGNYRIHIVERHTAQSPGIDAIRVHFDTGGEIVPIRVSHQFDGKHGIAMHSYFFSPDQRALIDRSELCKIQIAAAKDVKSNALQLADGTKLEVSIDDSGELFSPRAAANGQ